MGLPALRRHCRPYPARIPVVRQKHPQGQIDNTDKGSASYCR